MRSGFDGDANIQIRIRAVMLVFFLPRVTGNLVFA
jgi:hypothetical protein